MCEVIYLFSSKMMLFMNCLQSFCADIASVSVGIGAASHMLVNGLFVLVGLLI